MTRTFEALLLKYPDALSHISKSVNVKPHVRSQNSFISPDQWRFVPYIRWLV